MEEAALRGLAFFTGNVAKEAPWTLCGNRGLTLVEQGSENYRLWVKPGFLLPFVNIFYQRPAMPICLNLVQAAFPLQW